MIRSFGDHPQLFAVSRTSNRAKGDQDPSGWRPASTGDWCEYAEDWIAVNKTVPRLVDALPNAMQVADRWRGAWSYSRLSWGGTWREVLGSDGLPGAER